MDTEIKTIEDLSLNAWPSHQMQMYDGWILRFSYFYTYRTNCIEQIGPSLIPYERKIDYCEEVYRRWKTPCIYKISPVTDPALEKMLLARGYTAGRSFDVMTMDITDFMKPSEVKVMIENRVSYQWLEGLFRLKHTTDIIHRRIVPSMYDAIPKDEIAVSIVENETVLATGLGILDRDYVGVYAIHVEDQCRRRHFGRSIVSTILNEGRKHGAKKAYLQVVSDNEPAKSLYRSLGFIKKYDYHFTSREV